MSKRTSDLKPVWITAKEAIELAGLSPAGFIKARKEGHFRSYKAANVYSIRFKYDEVMADADNLWAGGKPNHEPDTFLLWRNKEGRVRARRRESKWDKQYR